MGRVLLIFPDHYSRVRLEPNLAIAAQRCLIRADGYVVGMAFPINAAKLSAFSRIERPEAQPLPGIDVGILLERDQGKQCPQV